jgi:multidrug efflux pump subunit AcrA (membrane-fusion protein)
MAWVLSAASIIAISVSQTSCSHSETPIQAKTSDESAPVAIVPVARVERTTITGKTVLTAEFQPFQEVDVMAKVAGYLRSINVDLGDRVREGQLLAELEIPEMTDEVSRATPLSNRLALRSARPGMSCRERNCRTKSRIFPIPAFWKWRSGSRG